MPKIALGVEYDGSQYYGWQNQIFDKLPTIQETLEKALSFIADQPVQIIAAGRTDAGVHATGQVIHFDTDSIRDERAWTLGTNSHLPHDICVRWARVMPEDFHARFSAIARRYQYLIYNSNIRTAIMHNKCCTYFHQLNTELMQQAANLLIGEHDFSSFRAAQCQAKTPVRTIQHINISRSDSWVTVEVQANAFLHHMVRNIVGVLLEIGSQKKPVKWISEILAARDRTQSGITAPAQGLYLIKVIYPEKFNLDPI